MDITKLLPDRNAARERGDKLFYTGQPCKNGHYAPRYVVSPMCVMCVRDNYIRRRPKTLAELKQKYADNPEEARAKERARAYRNPKWYWAKNALKNAKVRASAAGVPCTVTREYLASIVPDVCPVFGTPFILVGNGRVCMESATLDRKKPALGYVPGNVVVISQLANTIKSNASADEVARVAQWMFEEGL